MGGQTPIVALVAQVDAQLAKTLAEASQVERAQLRDEFYRRGQDYQTLSLMREMPSRLDSTQYAFTSLFAGRSAPDQQQLLTLLRDCYRRAASQAHTGQK